MKVPDIPDNWKTIKLHASSVPHFLHWDLTLVWILRQDPDLRPDTWRARVEGWRRLLFLFAGGRLRLQREPIPLPLRDFTEPYGITQLERLELKDEDDWRTVGVLSPVTVVRPLPDWTDEQLLRLPQYPEDQPAIRMVLGLLQEQIEELLEAKDKQSRELEENLARVLSKEVQAIPDAESVQPGLTSVPCSFLRAIGFQRAGQKTGMDTVPVRIIDRSVPPEPKYVPRCHCGALLTRRAEDPSVEVRAETIELACPSGHPNTVPIERFFIWRRLRPRQTPEYIVWLDRKGAFAGPQPAPDWPPEPVLERDNEVVFQWNPGALGGESSRTVLRLRFSDGAVRAESVQTSLFYEKLLVPLADTAGFPGLPVRWEWRDAWEDAGVVDRKQDQVRFDAIKIAGIPFRFSRIYAVNLRKDENLAVAVYPPPMHKYWRAYRAAAVGPSSGQYQLRAEGERLSQWAVDTDGWPGAVAVETEDGRAGTLYRLDHLTPDNAEEEAGAVRIGLDFGTSNTVLYFRRQGEVQLETRTHAVHPLDFRKQVLWLHTRPPDRFDTGWFLPSPEQAGTDPCLFSSALWMPQNGLPVLRWGGPPPAECASSHGFKWDEQLQNLHAHRLRYLREVFFYSIPYVLHALGNPKARAPLDVGFTYPLAFDHPQRQAYRKLMRETGELLRSMTGHSVQTLSVNESLAAVRALGAPNPGTLYLIGDMGGRTLDVALFACPVSAKAEDLKGCIRQIGSLEFGGELFLKKVSARQAGSGARDAFESAYWDLRGKVQSGAGARIFAGNMMIEESLDRLQTLALEFLRTMVAMFRREASGEEAEKELRVLLIGNGWRLRDLGAAELGPEWYFKDYCQRMAAKMEDKRVRIQQDTLPGVDSPKHLVAIGALKAADDQLRELDSGEPYPTRLPAGRGFEIEGRRIDWAAPTGQDGFVLASEANAKTGPIHFAFDDRPMAADEWETALEAVKPKEGWYPAEDQLREWLKKDIRFGRVLKGPLQLILEDHWGRHL